MLLTLGSSHVVTCILSLREGVTGGKDEDHKHKHEPDEELDIHSCYPSLACIINYFDIASSLNNGNFPGSPEPFRTFASPTTAINMVVKLMEGEAQCTRTMRKEGKAVDNLSMLTSYYYIGYTCR